MAEPQPLDIEKYKQAKYSSDLDTIPTKMDSDKVLETMPRKEFQKLLIAEEITKQLKPKAGEKPIAIFTGGGYGTFDTLVANMVKAGELPEGFRIIKGDNFRGHAYYKNEEPVMREAIRQQLAAQGKGEPTKEDIDRQYSSRNSNEANTLIGKEATRQAIAQGLHTGYESTFINDDTQKIAEEARKTHRTIAVIGDRDVFEAIKSQPHIEPGGTAITQKLVAQKINTMAAKVDELLLYNTDDPAKPVLIARKAADGTVKAVEGKEKEYTKFLAKATLDEKSVASKYSEGVKTYQEYAELIEREKAAAKDKATKDAGERMKEQGMPELPPMPENLKKALGGDRGR